MEKLAIDFDSLTTNIFKVGSGMVLSEPTVVAVNTTDKNQIKAYGQEAKKLIGKTAEKTKTVFPVFEGEIVNEESAIKLLNYFLKKVGVTSRLFGVHAVFGVPCGITGDLLLKYENVAKSAGINKVYFVEAPILSALGQRVPLNDFSPCFVIDMAGGTTNVAVLSLDGIIAGFSVNVGVNKICTDLIDYIAEVYGVQIGLLTAERIKNEIGSLSDDDGLSTLVHGRDAKTGTPRAISIKAVDILTPIKKYYDKIIGLAKELLVKLPPEVSAEIRKSGLYLSGAGVKVYDIERYFSNEFSMKINVAENADMSVALGGGIAIGNTQLLKKISVKTK